ncbi:MAG: MFS transporter [Acidobacteria bacterium]|nr:MFS transporter [Acidobacteriota bacterium]MBI3428369.1 MFS transporter [Acidobacteriota bacterium]
MAQTTTREGAKFFYGWLIVAVSTLAMLVTNGLAIGGLPVFFKPLLTDLGITDRSVIGTATMLTFLISGGLSSLSGNLLGRVNLRGLMSFGCVAMGIGLFIYSRAHNPTQIYLAHILLGLGLSFSALIPNTWLISNWFKRQRGSALGLVVMGTSLGGILIPQLARPLIEKYNWRVAMLAVSMLIWFVLLPAIWLIVQVHPRELGLEPDGAAPGTNDSATVAPTDVPANLPGLTLGEALRTPMFYVFSLCAATAFYSILAVVQQLNLFLQSPRVGLSLTATANIQSTMGAASIVGKLGFGWLSDRFPKVWINLICCGVLCLAGTLLLSLTAASAYPFALAFGFGYGGAFVLVQLMVAECFGLRELGRILGVITVVETVGGALGNFLTGKLAQAAGDYSAGFTAVFGASVIAFVAALLLVKLVPKRAVAS